MSRIAFIRMFMRPRLFALGVCFGLLACALLGRHTAHTSWYRDFARIGGPLREDATFFVTASQIDALIGARCKSDQVLVVVGGSSVLWGAGQPVSRLWTRTLQADLGDGFCVLNLAVPAGFFSGHGTVAMEMAAHRHRKAFLVTDAQFPPRDVIGHGWFRHVFWDAYYKHLLDPALVTTRQSRRWALLARQEEDETASDRQRGEQIRLGMWLDSYLYFNDLWTYFHYRYFMPVYSAQNAGYQFGPHRALRDYDYAVDLPTIRQMRNFPREGSPQFERENGNVRAFLYGWFDRTATGMRIKARRLADAAEWIADIPTTDFPGKILILEIPQAPYYLGRLTADERSAYAALADRQADVWKRNGYNVLQVTDLVQDDYADRVHINALGGDKLAAEVASRLRGLVAQSSP